MPGFFYCGAAKLLLLVKLLSVNVRKKSTSALRSLVDRGMPLLSKGSSVALCCTPVW